VLEAMEREDQVAASAAHLGRGLNRYGAV